MPHFFVKLIPPRPTFDVDMTATEREVMGRHASYLATLLDDGSGIAFGPVMDPAGIYGMGIIEAADEAAVRVLTDRDPIVAAKIGHYQIFPMRLLKAKSAA